MTTLGKYQILEELGVGSMGTVYRARDTVLEREVALKTIRAGQAVEPEIKERFYREARACARLQHPNIVTIHDFGEVDDTPYISMELLVGQDLRKAIEAKRDIPAGQKIELVAQVSDALAHAHSNGVVHRDIKPSNIYVVRDNFAKVLDFGIARIQASKLTVLGRVLGTPNYMAPEQIQGNICDSRSDLFSLAIVFFEFLTGVHPFQSAYIPRNIVGQPPAKLRSVNGSFPIVLEELLDKALQKSPEGRYQTAEEFSAALRSAIGELGPSPTWDNNVAPHPASLPAAPEPALSTPTLILDQTAETRASEFFALMQDCDSALEGKLVEKARRTLEQMKRLATFDSRFSIAVLEYERQVATLEAASEQNRKAVPPSPAPVTPTPRPAAPQLVTPQPVTPLGETGAFTLPQVSPPSAPHFSQPATPQFSQSSTPQYSPSSPPQASTSTLPQVSEPSPDLDATRLFSERDTLPAPTPAVRDELSFASPRTVHGSDTDNPAIPGGGYTQPAFPPPAIPPERTFPPRGAPPDVVEAAGPSASNGAQPGSPAHRSLSIKTLAIACGVTILLLGTAAAVHFLSPPKYTALPAIGTAVVTSDSARLFAAPSIADKSLALFPKGTRLNITRMPRSDNPEWISVQQITDKPGAPGFVRAAALGRWSSLQLAQLFDPGDSADVPQRTAYLESLRAGIAVFGKADQDNAWLEIAHQRIAIARQMKESGAASDQWQKYATDARADLAKVSDPALGEQSKTAEDTIADLLQPPAPPPPPAPPVQNFDLAGNYKAAEDLYSKGRYPRAIQLLKQILAVDNSNQDARLLLEKVQKAQKEEIELGK
jgi:serine/threonine protein kinase